MKPSVRGKFATLVHDDDSPVALEYETTVYVPPHVSNGKVYATVGSHPLMRDVDLAIKSRCDVAFSPVAGNKVVIKIPPAATVDPNLRNGDAVDLKLKLGNYGPHGYCWVAAHLVKKII